MAQTAPISVTVQGTVALQRRLQAEAFNIHPEELEGEELAEFLRWNFLAAVDELMEALHEVPGWKPWSSKETRLTVDDRRAVGAELIDALHFINNIFLAIGWDDSDVTDAYQQKAAENLKRQQDGYAR